MKSLTFFLAVSICCPLWAAGKISCANGKFEITEKEALIYGNRAYSKSGNSYKTFINGYSGTTTITATLHASKATISVVNSWDPDDAELKAQGKVLHACKGQLHTQKPKKQQKRKPQLHIVRPRLF